MKRESVHIAFFIIFILLFSFQDAAEAMDITLAWDADPEDNIGGYKLYYKTGSSGPPYNGTDAYQGPSPIDIPVTELGNPNHPEYTLTDLDDDQIHFFVVTAYSSQDAGLESGFSNEVNNSYGYSEDDEQEPPDDPNVEPTVGALDIHAGGGCFITSLSHDKKR
ncbi:MAG: fibronectin type III domain-containing protein [Deltaproteobacteria bacterium]|nr:fibronectin type III domain-containing protein [Deltaproteobacteria bacterium]